MDNKQLCKYFVEIRNGDYSSFDDIYCDMSIPIFTISCRILQSKEDAEDVMQDVFIKLFDKPPNPDVINIRAWIFKVTHNLAIDRKRKIDRFDCVSESEIDHLFTSASIDTAINLEKAVMQLHVDERAIVTYHINAELKFREISDIMTMPLGTVLWKYRKAIEKLRKILSEED